MHRHFHWLFLLVLLTFSVQTLAQDDSLSTETTRVIIIPNQTLNREALTQTLTTVNFEEIRTLEYTGFVIGNVAFDAIDALKASPQIAAVVPDYPMESHGNGRGVLALPDVYADGVTGTGVSIAILDTGIDTSSSYYPHIQSNIIGELCVTQGNCAPLDTYSGTDASSTNDHGTYVASVAVGELGYAPNASIVPVKVLSDSGLGYASDWITGLEQVLANSARYNIRVVNMSLGTSDLFAGTCDTGLTTTTEDDAFFSSIKALVDEMIDAGIVVVASTGNYGQAETSLPSCLSNVISVGATYESNIGRSPTTGNYADIISGFPACHDDPTSLTTVACFSNQNASVDVLAPGVHTVEGNGAYFGTSFSSPAVAGTIALMKSVDPTLTTTAI